LGTKNILRIPNIVRTKLHPTEKPVELMQVLVENSTNENDIVMDLFMGVGG
jgi:site-specific DNA-methyltransferase (adenine-specific)